VDAVSSDADYLARSLSEPTAFEPIFDRHFSAVHRYLHRRAGRELADELTAETFALAFSRRGSCRASGSVLPWLYGIATNLLHRYRRAERRQLHAYSRSGVDRSVAYEDEADARVDGSSLDARLAGALAAMRPRERDALLLYALQTSVTRRSLLHSTSRSGRYAPGFTGRVRPQNANSRRQRTFLRSRQQELV
jgi:RNA polymerase sigma-70 factor (ECF subfamily)